ncbi:hypothetical protein [Romboutsia sp.]|uniref:hypothetical protein n=1 Tax=Romboutsia sp. TaxID=1965302 RepID=UPI002C19FFE8|nr:hypothetical protein [Romboutsia sp.]HSQ90180.1 hypothetical protein [Romboutsia sp.]
MFKIGDKVRITEKYHKELVKSPMCNPIYINKKELGKIMRISNGQYEVKGHGFWTFEYVELDVEDNEI